jgi:hypothetical protein
MIDRPAPVSIQVHNRRHLETAAASDGYQQERNETQVPHRNNMP